MNSAEPFVVYSPIEHSDWPGSYLEFLSTIESYVQVSHGHSSPAFGLFQQVPVYASKLCIPTGKTMDAIWAYHDEVSEIAFIEQCLALGSHQNLRDIPGYDYDKHPQMFYNQANKGQQCAAIMLECCRTEREAFLSAFVMAALFELLEGRSSIYRSELSIQPWCNMLSAIQEVYQLSCQHVKLYNDVSLWDHKNTRLLPVDIHWSDVQIKNLKGLAKFLAVHLSLMLSQFSIVVPVSASEPYSGFSQLYEQRHAQGIKDHQARLAAWSELEQLRKQSKSALQTHDGTQEKIYIE